MMTSKCFKTIALFFFIAALPVLFMGVSFAKRSTVGFEAVTEGFISGLVEMAADKDLSQAARERLFETASAFAERYDNIRGDGDGFYKRIEERIRFLTIPSSGGDEETVKDPAALYAERFVFQQQTALVMARIDVFVMGLLRRALVIDAYSGVAVTDDKGRLLETAFGFAKIYSDLWGDGGAYHRRIEHIVATLPSGHVSTDEDIIREFQEAMRHDNTLAKQYLVEKVGPGIKPFVDGLIGQALIPILTETEKEIWLVTAMNFAKTYGEMTGDHGFHRKIHRRTFTARLSDPVLSEARDNLHIIDTPVSRRGARNLFIPNNIVIKAGETVRWINNDKMAHVIGTFDFLSDGHFFNPSLMPAATFDHTFTVAGEFYYICYIHRSMIGKITVKA
ncbi:MAG: plastocyanin/azurin family copper-binding protein [Thermodesulfobacteriota bacterium]